MNPITPPDPLMSEAGRRIADLQARGMGFREIGRHCSCDHETIRRLLYDPSSTMSRRLAEELETLHENMLTGRSKWGRMIVALVAHGWTYELISLRVGATVDHLRDRLVKDPTIIPDDQLGRNIEDLYRRHVRSLLKE